MFAAVRTSPRVTTAGTVTPIGKSPVCCSKLSAMRTTTSATASGVDSSRRGDPQPVLREHTGVQVHGCALDAVAQGSDSTGHETSVRTVTALTTTSSAGRPWPSTITR